MGRAVTELKVVGFRPSNFPTGIRAEIFTTWPPYVHSDSKYQFINYLGVVFGNPIALYVSAGLFSPAMCTVTVPNWYNADVACKFCSYFNGRNVVYTGETLIANSFYNTLSFCRFALLLVACDL